MRYLLIFILICSVFTSCSRTGQLSIEAQIIYNMGGPQPVARQRFYLLNKNPFSEDSTEIKEKLADLSEDEKNNYLSSPAAFFFLFSEAMQHPDKLKEGKQKILLGGLEAGKPFWSVYLVKETMTDFNGKAVFQDIPPGKYWLVGQTETRAAFTFWNLPVEINAGENKILLDQNNAVYSK